MSALTLHWWSPGRSPRTVLGEAVRHGAAWLELFKAGPVSFRNFGDEVSPLVVEYVTGRKVRWAPLRRAELASVGSLLNRASRVGFRGMVLGSGIRVPSQEIDLSSATVLAVRGHLTRQQLGLSVSIPLGDPGLLISELVAATPRHAPGNRGLVIPHFAVPNSKEGRKELSALRAIGWDVVLPHENPVDVASRIRDAPVVVTSSLHAVVFAHALGTPVRLCAFGGGRDAEPSFKYKDYYSVFGIEPRVSPVDVLAESDVVALVTDLEQESATVAARKHGVLDGIVSAAAVLK